MMNNYKKAVDAYERALFIDPTNDDIQAARDAWYVQLTDPTAQYKAV